MNLNRRVQETEDIFKFKEVKPESGVFNISIEDKIQNLKFNQLELLCNNQILLYIDSKSLKLIKVKDFIANMPM
jgi:hypothetical protein